MKKGSYDILNAVIIMHNETIAAISTAPGIGAISIVRMSGEEALKILSNFFKPKDLRPFKSHEIRYGKIFENDQLIDEVLVSYFQAPKSFTQENMVEINTHGGHYIAQKVLSLCLNHGARLAENGEFTERAFLNGRIDLTQAESVLDMIESRSELSLKLATQGLSGQIRAFIEKLRADLLQLIAQIEVNIDYPEYDDVNELTQSYLIPKTESIKAEIQTILDKSVYGQIIRSGIKTAIVGRPNVGKSSLLNALINEEKAIVTEIQGTTRDLVEGFINIGGVTLHLIDTAGIRETSDFVEKIGIEKSKKALQDAELVLLILDQSEPLTEMDLELLELTKNKQRIVILNKDDLPSKLNQNFEDALLMSVLKKTNLDVLEKRIHGLYLDGKINLDQGIYLSNPRQVQKLNEALLKIDQALVTARQSYPVDMIEMDIKSAWEILGEIIGETSDTALIDALFSQFCLGK